MTTDIPTVITNERRRVADWLDELPDETWSGPSLCERWSVQDTVGHMTFPWRVSTPRLLAQMVRYRGFEEASAVTAAGLGDIGPEALVAQIRANVDNPKRPPGTKPEDLLAEVILHPLDIAIPNGQTWEPDPAGIVPLLDHVTQSKNGAHYHPPGGLDGVRFVATDADWSYGAGEEARGTAVDVLLTVAGRRVPGRPDAPGTEILASRRAP